jgi:hypothetical protein
MIVKQPKCLFDNDFAATPLYLNGISQGGMNAAIAPSIAPAFLSSMDDPAAGDLFYRSLHPVYR